MGTECPSPRPPAILWFLSHRWERNSPRRAKPCRTARRVVAPYTQQTISHRPLIRHSFAVPPSPRGKACGRPHGAAPTVCLTIPDGEKRTGHVGSAKPGANVEPHHLKFSSKPGPLWARRELQSTTQILRAGNTPSCQRDDPRNGVRGKATMSTKCSSGAVPGGVLPTLPPWAKELAARWRRNPPAKNGRQRRRAESSRPTHNKRFLIAPSSGPPGHLPPKGKAY